MVVASGVPSDVATKVVGLIGGHPLGLQLAIQVLHRDGLEAFEDLATDNLAVSGAIRSQLVEGFLYKRILGHLHDKELEKLALPGLTVRRIDPGVIREVLAEPCGLSVPDDAVAYDLFERLSREVGLVQPGRAGALYHRPDVRRIMLVQLRADSAGQFDAINRKAAEYYRSRTADQTTPDPEARAEEIYHRLALGEPLAQVERLWVDGVEEYLRGSVEDFTRAEPARFLASRLGVEIPPDLWDDARIEDWELQAAKRAQDLMSLGQNAKALAVITSRPERTPTSPLFLLEARLRLHRGDRDTALSVARAGIASATTAGNDTIRLDLLLFLGDALWLGDDRTTLRAILGEAVAVADRLSDPMRCIDALARFLRLGRALDVPSSDDAERRADLGMRLKRFRALGCTPILRWQGKRPSRCCPKTPKRFASSTV